MAQGLNIRKSILKVLSGILGVVVLLLVLLYVWGGQGQWDERQYVTTTSRPVSIDAQTDSFAIITYNLGWMSGMTNNRPMTRTDSMYKAHFERLVGIFKELPNAVIAMQEVDFAANRSFNWQQADSLVKYVGFANYASAVNWDKRYVPFPYWPLSTQFGATVSGQTVFSPYLIQAHARNVLPTPPMSFLYKRFYIDRLIQTVIITWHDTSIALLNVHLDAWSQPTRQIQATRVAALADSLRHHHLVVIAGDFNAEPPPRQTADNKIVDSTLLALADRGFSAATYNNRQTTGWLNSYSSVAPKVSIDHIFYHPSQWRVSSARVLVEAGDISDHLPIMAVLYPRLKTPLQARKDQE